MSFPSFTVLNRDGSHTTICYPSRLSLNYIILGRKVNGGGILLDVDLEVTQKGWIARSRAGTVITAERPGKLRDKTQFVA